MGWKKNIYIYCIYIYIYISYDTCPGLWWDVKRQYSQQSPPAAPPSPAGGGKMARGGFAARSARKSSASNFRLQFYNCTGITLPADF